MICHCGGQTIRMRAREGDATLKWHQCGACGRCDGFELHICDVQAANGQAARRVSHDPAVIALMSRRYRKRGRVLAPMETAA
jgi:hypothetical protein